MAKGSIAALLLPLCLCAHAANERFKYTPPREQLRADLASPFIQGVMREPFTSSHEENQTRIDILEESGNTPEAKSLEQAENRRLLAAMMGEAHQTPATVGDAIAAEQGKPSLEQALQAALDRVSIGHAPDEAANTAKLPEGFVEAGPGVWTRVGNHESLEVLMLATIRNGLAMPLHHAGFKVGHIYYCPTKPESGAAPIKMPPGATTVVMCRASDLAERMPEHVKAAAAHALGLPIHPFTVSTEAGSIVGGGGHPSLSRDGDAAQRQQAWSRLVDAPCAQKGTCVQIEQGAEARQAEKARKGRPALMLILGGFLAFIAAVYAASRLRGDLDRAGVIRSLLSVAVIGYSALLLALLYAGVRPGRGSFDGMLAIALVVYGGLPFLGMLAIVGTAMGRNRLHAFAGTFGIGVVLVSLGMFAMGF